MAPPYRRNWGPETGGWEFLFPIPSLQSPIPSPQSHIQQQQGAEEQQHIGWEIPTVDSIQAAKDDTRKRQLSPSALAHGIGRRGGTCDGLQGQRQRQQAI